MKKIKSNSAIFLFLLAMSLVAVSTRLPSISNAASLEPSAPPASTMHTLDEVYAAASSAPVDDPVPLLSDIQN